MSEDKRDEKGVGEGAEEDKSETISDSSDEETDPGEEDTEDGVTDAVKGTNTNGKRREKKKPLVKEDPFYNMRHEKRGKAIIFNHFHYDAKLYLDPRNGTERDVIRLKQAFKKHSFKVEVYDNLTVGDIQYAVQTIIAKGDHSNSDCVAVVILTHGKYVEGKGSVLYARDGTYQLDTLIEMITPEKCTSLAGKPKLFFVQACRGEKKDKGTTIAVDSFPVKSYKKIPTYADFFIAQSTIPRFVSIRNKVKGSWFMKALSMKLMEEDSNTKSIFSIMTEVIAHVAFKCESDTENLKQIPTFTSRLTKDLIFVKK
ncbi:caspase-1-like isoform X2 [Cloeon dipterum]|uniref:caspase-1-like isoform X2 n=1 Tax=Cloeon dipterum TaxID=197152 RepID=UPI0032209F3D